MISYIHPTFIWVISWSCSDAIECVGWMWTSNIMDSVIGKATTTLTSTSAFLFSSWGICLTLFRPACPNGLPHQWGNGPCVRLWPHILVESWICLTTNWESLCTFDAASIKARSRLTIIASYLATLLDARKLRWTDCSIYSMVGKDIMSPTPTPDVLEASSTWRIYQWLVV